MIETLSLLSLYLSKSNKIITSNSIFIVTFIYLSYLGNSWIDFSCYFLFFYCDKFCNLIVLLTLWISNICIIITKKENILIIILILITVFCLRSSNIFLFYILFEIRLIPLFIIIYWWSTSKERYSARLFILMYTISGSIPLLLSIFHIYFSLKRLEWVYLFYFNITSPKIVYWNLIIAFLVKIPIYSLHSWLPKAHVQAPVYGSIILARIVLKLGGIGLIRTIIIFLSKASYLNLLIINLIIIGSFWISIICLTQLDLKIIVAYSSIVHIGVATIRIITINKWGYSGAILLIISHGLSSSSLFYIVNLIYLRTGTRLIILNKSLINLLPKIIIIWFFSCIRNLGAPFSLNFFRELVITNRIISFNILFTLPLIFINLIRRIYSIQLYILPSHGNNPQKIFPPFINEYLLSIIHLIPLNLAIWSSYLWIINL